MKESILREKSFKFAIRIVSLYKYLCDEKKELMKATDFILGKELIKMLTSSIKTAKKSLTTNR